LAKEIKGYTSWEARGVDRMLGWEILNIGIKFYKFMQYVKFIIINLINFIFKTNFKNTSIHLIYLEKSNKFTQVLIKKKKRVKKGSKYL